MLKNVYFLTYTEQSIFLNSYTDFLVVRLDAFDKKPILFM